MKKALITGITGQDGSYLAEFLLEKDYQVHGMYRRSSTDTTERIKHLLDHPNFSLHYGDMTDSHSINTLVELIKPDEVYNLAAQSDVSVSFKLPELTHDVNAVGVERLLSAIRRFCPEARFYQASTSELFGVPMASRGMQEGDQMIPKSPYGISKLSAYWTTINYREAYKIFAVNGILFNHESPRRGDGFVTQKIVKQMVQIFKRERDVLELGNLSAKRDWGFAGDYVQAMWLMLQADKPNDYIIATGRNHSVRDFVNATAEALDMDLLWRGEGVRERAYDRKSERTIIRVNPKYYRPVDINELLGNPERAELNLGWKARTKFKELVKLMVDAELEKAP